MKIKDVLILYNEHIYKHSGITFSILSLDWLQHFFEIGLYFKLAIFPIERIWNAAQTKVGLI